jgi:glycosyltransferase EpsD
MKWLSEQGCEVHTLTDDGELLPGAAKAHMADFTKQLTSLRNSGAVLETRRMLLEQRYGVVVTNTTLAAAVARVAVLAMPKRERPFVCHIAHGYLFDGRSGMRRLLYLLPELLCSKATDLIVVMNREDNVLAERRKLGSVIRLVHGMGVDGGKFKSAPIEHRFSKFTFIYAADFSRRKNQEALIRAFAKAAESMPNAELLLAGDGSTLGRCKSLSARLNISGQVRFLGHVSNMHELLPKCDAAVSTSRYEGLPFNIMEAMLCGLPIIASRIRGHIDLLEGTAGEMYSTESELANKLLECKTHGKRSVKYPNIEYYTLQNVSGEWKAISRECLQKIETRRQGKN